MPIIRFSQNMVKFLPMKRKVIFIQSTHVDTNDANANDWASVSSAIAERNVYYR